MKDITKEEYAEWLEDSLKVIVEGEPESIAIAAKLKDGEVVTGYFDCSPQDKALLISHMAGDYIMAIVKANAGMVKEALDNLEEGEED